MARPASRSRPRPALLVGGALALLALGAVLALLLLDRQVPSGSADPAVLGSGKALYAANCAACHGANLEGQPNWQQRQPSGLFPAPPQDASGHAWHHADSYLLQVIEEGGAAVSGGAPSGMPGFGGKLSDAEIGAILSFIKSTWPPEVRAQQERISR